MNSSIVHPYNVFLFSNTMVLCAMLHVILENISFFHVPHFKKKLWGIGLKIPYAITNAIMMKAARLIMGNYHVFIVLI